MCRGRSGSGGCSRGCRRRCLGRGCHRGRDGGRRCRSLGGGRRCGGRCYPSRSGGRGRNSGGRRCRGRGGRGAGGSRSSGSCRGRGGGSRGDRGGSGWCRRCRRCHGSRSCRGDRGHMGRAGRGGSDTRLLRCRATGHQTRSGALQWRGGGGRDRDVAVGPIGRSGFGRLCGGRGLLGRGLLGGGLLDRCCRLLGLHRSAQSLTVGLAAGAVCLRVLDGRRMALDAHPQGQAEVKGLLVGQAKLMSELVYPDLLRQRLLLPFLRCRTCQCAHTTLHPRTSQHRTFRIDPPRTPGGGSELLLQAVDRPCAHLAPKGPIERPALLGQIDAGSRIPAQPGSPAREQPPRHQGSILEAHHPYQGVRRLGPSAPDAGPLRGYA